MKNTVILLFLCSVSAAFAGEYSANGVSVSWTETELTVRNALFSRTYRADGAVLKTVSFRTASSNELVRPPKVLPSAPMAVSAAAGQWGPASAKDVSVSVRTSERAYLLRLWPTVPGVVVSTDRPYPRGEIPPPPGDTAYVLAFRTAERMPAVADRVADRLRFAGSQYRLDETVLFDQTDDNDTPRRSVVRYLPTMDRPREISVSALDVRDILRDEGVAFLRFAPMPASRPRQLPDFAIDPYGKTVYPMANGYPLAELAYEGGELGRIRAVQAVQRALRPYRAGRDGVLLANSWGAGVNDAPIREQYLLDEVAACAELGADVIQVDDGWQKGRTSNTRKELIGGKKGVWVGFWAADPEFWRPDPERLPRGLDPIVAAVREKGLRLGLWYAPDSSDDCANWRKDADCLLDLYARYGVANIKIDALRTWTPAALERQQKLFDSLVSRSHGEITIDLDCTADVRAGLLGLPDVGTLFWENRYAIEPPSYVPHRTLRNLWELAHWVDPVRLRMEFGNPGQNPEVYGDDPFAPARWPVDALFAIVMTASPLAWMETSRMPPAARDAMKPLIARWKAERMRLHAGTTVPIGATPDGRAWTGFATLTEEGDGYAVVFRERNPEPTGALDMRLPFGTGSRSVEVLGGRGNAELTDGVLRVVVPKELDFIWLKIGGEVARLAVRHDECAEADQDGRTGRMLSQKSVLPCQLSGW